jgi:hypothetical protein
MAGKIRFKHGNTTDLPVPFPRFSDSKVLVNFNNPTLARLNLKKTNHFPFCGTTLNARHNSVTKLMFAQILQHFTAIY